VRNQFFIQISEFLIMAVAGCEFSLCGLEVLVPAIALSSILVLYLLFSDKDFSRFHAALIVFIAVLGLVGIDIGGQTKPPTEREICKGAAVGKCTSSNESSIQTTAQCRQFLEENRRGSLEFEKNGRNYEEGMYRIEKNRTFCPE
jgi:hypothetical protein